MVQGVKSTVAPATHASKAKAQAKAKARSPVKQKKRVPVAVKKGARVMKVAKVKVWPAWVDFLRIHLFF
jgi:hypothetical protein